MTVVSERRFKTVLSLILNSAGVEGFAFVEFLPIWEAEGRKIRFIKDRTKWLEKKTEEYETGKKVCFQVVMILRCIDQCDHIYSLVRSITNG